MSSSTWLPGARIGKYRIVAHIATGGMGTVYRAVDETSGRVVALKVLGGDLAANPNLVERFRREARHTFRLSHKNIVTLFESDEVDGVHYLAMEFIDGIDLGQYIERKGKLNVEEARRILIQACKALEHAFAQGITHRDIKPSNFLLANEQGRCRVKLTDLGLARTVNEDDYRVTRAGTTVGTVDYLPPEQARDSSNADVRSDIYSLGCTFYHMLAGHPPFAEGGLGERIYKHMVADPPDLRTINPSISAGLWAILQRMLAKEPDDRFQTPTELIEALRSLAGIATAPRQADEQQAERENQQADSNSTSDSEEVEQAPSVRGRPTPPSVPAAGSSDEHEVKRSNRRTTLPDLNTIPDEPPENLGITREQRSAAAGQFTHATEVIRTNGDSAYALQLLLSCCKLDPGNVLYRKILREVGWDAAGGKRGGWFGSLTNLPMRGRILAARHTGDHRKVLEYGEELLLRQPGDVSVQLDMADAAETLELHALALWLLEQARRRAPADLAVLRALAHLYERQKRFTKAIAIWEQVRQVNPSDPDAGTRIKDLAANDTIARGKFRR